MLSISMPCVLTAAAIGLVVGIIQAVTQVQEQTIAAAPKIFAVFLVIIIGGMGFIKLLTNLFSDGNFFSIKNRCKSDKPEQSCKDNEACRKPAVKFRKQYCHLLY